MLLYVRYNRYREVCAVFSRLHISKLTMDFLSLIKLPRCWKQSCWVMWLVLVSKVFIYCCCCCCYSCCQFYVSEIHISIYTSLEHGSFLDHSLWFENEQQNRGLYFYISGWIFVGNMSHICNTLLISKVWSNYHHSNVNSHAGRRTTVLTKPFPVYNTSTHTGAGTRTKHTGKHFTAQTNCNNDKSLHLVYFCI